MEKQTDQSIQQSIEASNSVEISINAKGQFSGKVKVYATTIEEAMAKSLEKATQLEEVIKNKNQ